MGMDERQPADDIAAQGAPASPDALRAIVARHQRTRTRTLGVALAVALVAGPVAGWALGHNGGGGQQVATGSGPNTPNAANPGAPTAANVPGGALSGGPSSGVIAYPGGTPPKATHLFTRTTADGITIRAYRIDPPAPPEPSATTSTPPKAKQTICPKPMTVKPGAPASGSTSSGEADGRSGGAANTAPLPPPGPNAVVNEPPPPPCAPGEPPVCKAAPSVLAEVSNDAAVGQSFDAIDEKQPSDALSHLAVGAFGVPENSPATFVTVQTGPGVDTVRLRLPSGPTDQMAPSGGVAVLALSGQQPPPDGTVVEALDGNGKVLQSTPVTNAGPRMGFACANTVGPVRAYQAPAPATPPTTR